LVYGLYGLTEEEIGILEGGWFFLGRTAVLEREIGSSVWVMALEVQRTFHIWTMHGTSNSRKFIINRSFHGLFGAQIRHHQSFVQG
jgi:hypothetical protein